MSSTRSPEPRVTTEPVPPPAKLYADRRPWELEPYYSRHIAAMTAEGLHGKAEIAEELAWRDAQIAAIGAQLDAAYAAIGLSLFSSEPLSAFLTRALALDTAYPVRDVLEQLADAADHLLSTHSCDAHGYEGIGLARDSARQMVAVLGGGEESIAR